MLGLNTTLNTQIIFDGFEEEDQKPNQEDVPDDSPSFEELMLLVFSGPMCFECLDENEEAENEEAESADDEGAGEALWEQIDG